MKKLLRNIRRAMRGSRVLLALALLALLALAPPVLAGASYQTTLQTNLSAGLSATVETNLDFSVTGSTEVAFAAKFQMNTNMPGSTAGNLALGFQRSVDGSIFESGTNIVWTVPNNGTNYVIAFTNWNVGATDTLRLRSIANSSTNAAITNLTVYAIKKQIAWNIGTGVEMVMPPEMRLERHLRATAMTDSRVEARFAAWLSRGAVSLPMARSWAEFVAAIRPDPIAAWRL
ncbi:MAG: hypothetical protein NTY01_05565 [Verrucomicrobia bacterium]|nr:hypothetical protein [Verrucomicrobiota bacterium]